MWVLLISRAKMKKSANEMNSGGPDPKVANEGGKTNYGADFEGGKGWEAIDSQGDKNIFKIRRNL
jgi:hypothetical protein